MALCCMSVLVCVMTKDPRLLMIPSHVRSHDTCGYFTIEDIGFRLISGGFDRWSVKTLFVSRETMEQSVWFLGKSACSWSSLIGKDFKSCTQIIGRFARNYYIGFSVFLIPFHLWIAAYDIINLFPESRTLGQFSDHILEIFFWAAVSIVVFFTVFFSDHILCFTIFVFKKALTYLNDGSNARQLVRRRGKARMRKEWLYWRALGHRRPKRRQAEAPLGGARRVGVSPSITEENGWCCEEENLFGGLPI